MSQKVFCIFLPSPNLENIKAQKSFWDDRRNAGSMDFLMVRKESIVFCTLRIFSCCFCCYWNDFIEQAEIVCCKQKAWRERVFHQLRAIIALNYFFSQTNFQSKKCLPSTYSTIDAQTRLGRNETIRNVFYLSRNGSRARSKDAKLRHSFMPFHSSVRFRDIEKYSQSKECLTSVDGPACRLIN